MTKKEEKLIINGEDLICPLSYAINIVGGKWKLPIICILANGSPVRYGVLKKKLIKITNMMLSQSLKELETLGMVHREQYNEVPPRVEYTLTKKGISIFPILIQFANWGTNNMDEKIINLKNCDICKETT